MLVFLQRTDSDATFFYSDKYRDIINECAELKEDGTPDTSEDGMNIKIQEDKVQDCVAMIQELEATDVGDFALKIDVSDLEKFWTNNSTTLCLNGLYSRIRKREMI